MEPERKRNLTPTSEVPTAIAVSMASIDGALTELVNRMEREIANRGSIAPESASELRSLRIGAEQLLAAQTDTKFVV